MQSTTMILFYSTSFQLIIAMVAALPNSEYNGKAGSNYGPEAPFELKLRIKREEGDIITINLKKVDSILANEHLPIMVTPGRHRQEYEQLDENVMRDVGEFAMYHDYCTKSAFVYFRKEGILNGVVDVSYSAKGILLNELNQIHKVQTMDVQFYPNSPHVIQSRVLRSSDDQNTTRIRMRRHGTERKIVYPELLVAITYDMYKALGKNFTRAISHILTVYNGADMLYRLVKSADIKLNIATIVIETKRRQWKFVPYKRRMMKVVSIDVDQINFRVHSHFINKENYFPRDSYDFIVFNSRFELKKSSELMHGVAKSCPLGFLFPRNYYCRYNLAVRDFENYESYTTVAHELAHVFTAKHDEDGPQYLETDACGVPSLMSSAGCTTSCLRWSHQTETEFEKFFSSPAYCNLMNFPRSLFSNKPRKVFTGMEQCNCYGFKVSQQLTYNVDDWCNKSLQCSDKSKKNSKFPVPTDGTPCGPGKVCWASSCVHYEKDVELTHSSAAHLFLKHSFNQRTHTLN